MLVKDVPFGHIFRCKASMGSAYVEFLRLDIGMLGYPTCAVINCNGWKMAEVDSTREAEDLGPIQITDKWGTRPVE